MTYKPKEGEDAITRDDRKAVFVIFEPNDRNPYLFKIDGVPCLYSPSGRRFLAGDDRSDDLVGKWEDPQPKKKAKKLKWKTVHRLIVESSCYEITYEITKRDGPHPFLLLKRRSLSGLPFSAIDYYPTKKAAKRAAQEDADKL